jgi:hypothetical protein
MAIFVEIEEIKKKYFKQGFEMGVEMQSQKMYSEEDIKRAFKDGEDNKDFSDIGFYSILTENEWFEQFKKKNGKYKFKSYLR